MNKIAILCVLKSGGDFSVRDVIKLKIMLGKNITIPYVFYCLTDMDPMGAFNEIPLRHGYKGWWSKLELFRPLLTAVDRIFYFDLDTVIVSNIDAMLLQDKDFIALKPFNPYNAGIKGYMASGIMGWKNNGLYDFLYKDFDYKQHHKQFLGDQDYLSYKFKENGMVAEYWQDLVDGVYSYKRHVKGNGLNGDTRVVCFHGYPRPYQVSAGWIQQAMA